MKGPSPPHVSFGLADIHLFFPTPSLGWGDCSVGSRISLERIPIKEERKSGGVLFHENKMDPVGM